MARVFLALAMSTILHFGEPAVIDQNNIHKCTAKNMRTECVINKLISLILQAVMNVRFLLETRKYMPKKGRYLIYIQMKLYHV